MWSPIKNYQIFSKNLYSVVFTTLCSKSEVMLERMKSLMNLDFSIWMQVDIESYILGLIAKWMRRFFKMNGSCFFLWYIVCISHKLQEIFTYNLYVCFKERKMYCMKKKIKKNYFGNEELELIFEITGATFSNIKRPEQFLKQNIFSIFYWRFQSDLIHWNHSIL